MEEQKCRVRLNGKDYEDVVVRELEWQEDAKCARESMTRTLNQKTMKYDEDYDGELLADLRMLAAMKTKTPATREMIRRMPRKDRMVLNRAYYELNEVVDEEKSRPVGDGGGSPGTHEGRVEPGESGAPIEDLADGAVRDESRGS